ncbi:MAG: sugar ABC transporter ATP-binding protein [Lachnospiraceae bacterium]|nr:sugar ABC transporter ATP-binding protein [Lachnospiraceae bacterium]
MAQDDTIFKCDNITKTFGGTKALRGVRLDVKKGEVHALMGENGAGKSTLMNCVIGLIKADSGTMEFEGQPYSVRGPVEAMEKGIYMIHQELHPEPHLSIAESIFLHRENMRGIFLNKSAQNARTAEILKKFNFNYSPRTLMKELTLAQVQMVEIIKAVSSDARMIIMDEPTSSLDANETEHLFNTIKELQAKGVSVIYISHRMDEIFEIADRVSVFRDGQYIGTKLISEITKSELITMMVGRTVEAVFPKVDVPIGDEVFRVEGLSGKGFRDISFCVHAGEILGLSGLVGSGRSETARAIFGLDRPESGSMYLNGEKITNKNTRQAIRKGICMVNEDRKNYGLCLLRSIRENVSLPNLESRQKGLFIQQGREKREVKDVAEKLRVKAGSIEHTGFSLSGGNQQKVVLAKWIMASPKLMILDEPTRGVDVGAKSEIHTMMCEFAAKGMAILMISSEIEEIMGMSDRILIYHEGRINGEVSREEIVNGTMSQKEILAKEFGQ